MAEVGSAYVSLMPSARGFGSKMQSELSPEVASAGKGVGSKFGTAFKVGALAVVGGALLVGKFLKGAVEEAREAQVVTARTENVIKRMGNAAGISAKQVASLAGSISQKTGIDDEAIQSGQNLLLTFGNIRNEAGKGNQIFTRTSQLMVDMSAAMGTDAKSSAIQLGKALNDPIKGVSALTRVGVSFTEGQKKTIESLVKSGKTLDAQKLILGEVEKQFGGAAEAMATPADKVAVAWGNVKEQIGTALLPVIDRVLNKVLAWMPAITAGIDTAMASVRGWVSSAQALFSGGSGLGGGASSFASILTGTVLPAVQQAVGYLRDQLLPAVMGVVNAFKYEFQTIAPIVVAAIQGIVARIAPHWDEIKAGLAQVVSTFKSSLELVAVVVRTGTDILQALWRKFGERFVDYLATTFLNVVQIVRGALNIIQGVVRLVTAVIKGDWGKAWDAVKQILRGAWQIIEGVVRQGLNTIRFILSNLGSVLKTIASKAWDLVKAAFKTGVDQSVKAAGKLPTLAVKAIQSGISLMIGVGENLIQGFISGIVSKAKDVISAVTDVVKGGIDAAKGLLNIASPSKVFDQIGRWTMEGFERGIKSGSAKVLKAMDDALTKTIDRVGSYRDGIKSRLDGVRSEFTSLRDSIASTFAGNLFDVSAIEASVTDTLVTGAATVGQAFWANLNAKKAELTELIAAFKKLKRWGVPAGFLSQMFASGNGALILEMASGTKGAALTEAGLFGEVQSLSNQLGTDVAGNQFNQQLKPLERQLERANRHLRHLDTLADDLARSLDRATASAHRGAA